MNILVFDWDGSIGALVRAALVAEGRRVSLESNPTDARLKLETALFDALVIGPAGMPAELAEYVETEWPAMPIVIAGVENELPPEGRVVAVLARPLSVERLTSALRRAERCLAEDAQKTYDMPVDVIAGEQRLACRVIRASRGVVMLASQDGVAVEGPLAIRRGARTVEGDVAFRDRGLIAVRVAIAELEVDDAQGDGASTHGGGVSGL